MMVNKKTQTDQEVVELGETGRATASPPGSIRLLCFVWTPRRPNDEALMPAARKELERCDGRLFFTDVDAPGDDSAGDWIRVQLPQQLQGRWESNWLDHKNMIGVAPVWERIFQMDLASQYDWIIHVELDHFVMVDRVRNSILQYLDIIKASDSDGGNVMDQSLLLCWGNAFVFNSKLVREMAANWGALGAPIQEGIPGQGCPRVSQQRVMEEGGKCEQDMAYPHMADVLKVKRFGALGCGQPSQTPSGVELPLTCWQLDMAYLADKKPAHKAKLIQGIAALRGANSLSEAQERCRNADNAIKDIMAELCDKLYAAVNVPLMHNIKWPDMHEVAQQLLR